MHDSLVSRDNRVTLYLYLDNTVVHSCRFEIMKRVITSDNDPKAPSSTESKGESMSKKSRKTLFILFASLVLDLLGFTVILPLMPSILEYYGRTDGQVRLVPFTY